ncbi:Hypothetical protein CAP_5913 [Chondromyces apiculatus DSM 436]|uniref:Uncharacterized protein n=1 Tax=Chondromyces apiculatus DSM 436 TaxID=1192034 RepID=A0A017TFU1_9BACT|nr:Hypothetical protein CAP_5913 [Chondromyces apiculatus DSM 436]
MPWSACDWRRRRRRRRRPPSTCDNGRHELSSAGFVGLTVWGWGSAARGLSFNTQAVSYAYPAGASIQPINTVTVPAMPQSSSPPDARARTPAPLRFRADPPTLPHRPHPQHARVFGVLPAETG